MYPCATCQKDLRNVCRFASACKATSTVLFLLLIHVRLADATTEQLGLQLKFIREVPGFKCDSVIGCSDNVFQQFSRLIEAEYGKKQYHKIRRNCCHPNTDLWTIHDHFLSSFESSPSWQLTRIKSRNPVITSKQAKAKYAIIQSVEKVTEKSENSAHRILINFQSINKKSTDYISGRIDSKSLRNFQMPTQMSQSIYTVSTLM